MKNIFIVLISTYLILACAPQDVINEENPPKVNTNKVSEITRESAKLNGEVVEEGYSAASERGFVYSDKNTNPSVSDNKLLSGYGKGIYTVKLDKLPVHTKYYFKAFATNSKGTAYGVIQSFTTLGPPRDSLTKVVEVKSLTGRVWMDRNLGASQVAINSIDEKAFGDLYQWGRPTDGHQLRSSNTTETKSISSEPSNNNFIINGSSWTSSNDNLWQGVKGINNPCPSGFRLPTEDEWELERKSWVSNNAAGAFSSPLKLPNAGMRYWRGNFFSDGSQGFYWSSTVFSRDGIPTSSIIYFDKSNVDLRLKDWGYRIYGESVRCIKD
jgi:hypothetical protein